MEVSNSILEKIQKLMALEERAGTLAEAANATARISEILLKYNLTRASVQSHKPDDGVVAQRGRFDDYQTPYDGKFAENLLTSIALFNFCKLFTHPDPLRKNKGEFTIIGKSYNVEVTTYMFLYCLNNIKILFNAYYEKFQDRITESKKVSKRAFYQGAILAITQRLHMQKKEAEQTHGSEVILSMVKLNDSVVNKKVEEIFPTAKIDKRPMKLCRDMDSLKSGYIAGKELNLSKGLEDSTGKNHLEEQRKLITQ